MGISAPPRPHECVRAFEDQFVHVHRTLRRLGVPAADVEDLAQEVFIVMWRRWSELDRSRPLAPWLAGIAFNVFGNHLRRARREIPQAELEARDPAPHGEDGLELTRARRIVLGALERLPDRYRTVLILRDIDGVPMRQIAALQGVPLFTAYTRLRKARRALAQAIKLQADRPDRRSAGLLVPVGWLPALLRVALTAGAAGGLFWLGLPATIVHGEAASAALESSRRPAALPGAAAPRGALALWQATAARLKPPRLISPPIPVADPVESSLTRGLLAYWRFDDASGPLVRDLTGRGGDCVIRRADPGAVWTRGRLGSAIQLDADGWLECPQPHLTDGAAGELSVSAWVMVLALPGRGNRAVVSRQVGRAASDHFFLGFSNAQLFLASHSWGVAIRHRAPIDNRWHHLAFSRSQHEVTLYLDGKPVASRTIRTPRPDPVDTPILIGGGSNRPGVVRELLEGAVDEILLFGRALGEAEIAALAAGAQPSATW